MIEGVVSASNQAELILNVQGPVGPPREIVAVVDTGYSGFLTLPPEIVSELDLRFKRWGRGALADGSRVHYPIHEVTLHWWATSAARE